MLQIENTSSSAAAATPIIQLWLSEKIVVVKTSLNMFIQGFREGLEADPEVKQTKTAAPSKPMEKQTNRAETKGVANQTTNHDTSIKA